jgi:hypothetical protein
MDSIMPGLIFDVSSLTESYIIKDIFILKEKSFDY